MLITAKMKLCTKYELIVEQCMIKNPVLVQGRLNMKSICIVAKMNVSNSTL